jgi:hypothetical protein
MKILSKQTGDKIEFSIEDGVNNLGVKFSVDKDKLDLEKVLNFIADYVTQNYTCLHQRNDRGTSYVK